MVMGGDSCSKGRGFESRLLMLDGHFFTYLPICCKICNVCLKRRKQIKKRPHWPILKQFEVLKVCGPNMLKVVILILSSFLNPDRAKPLI